MSDCVSKNRQAKGDSLPDRRGMLSSSAKLTNSQVIKIRELKKQGEKPKDLAVMFNVSVDNIRRIIRRNTWRHI